MSDNHDIAKLDDLIVTTIDSVKGYEHSADQVPNSPYTPFFRDMARERREVVEALQARSRQLQGTPADYGSLAAALHRRVEDLRVAFGGGDEAIVKEVERGEDYLKEEYERALADDGISSETMTVIRHAFESVQRGHDWASRLKKELEAAG